MNIYKHFLLVIEDIHHHCRPLRYQSFEITSNYSISKSTTAQENITSQLKYQ